MKKFKSFLGALICFFFLFTTISIPIYAASPYLDYGSKTGYISVTYSSNYNQNLVGIITKSIAAWNDSNANVKITVTPYSSNKIIAKKYSDSWYGSASQTYNSNGETTKFTIKMNKRTIKNDAIKYNKFARSTLVHEFGHIFWLCDNPSTGAPSIMKYNRDRNTMYKPQSYDISNVNKKYS